LAGRQAAALSIECRADAPSALVRWRRCDTVSQPRDRCCSQGRGQSLPQRLKLRSFERGELELENARTGVANLLCEVASRAELTDQAACAVNRRIHTHSFASRGRRQQLVSYSYE
jgi:hypothetical protein